MFERVPQREFGRVSALWNLAFDAGMGIGAVGFGILIGRTGYPTGFAVTAAPVLAALILVARDRNGAARTPADDDEEQRPKCRTV